MTNVCQCPLGLIPHFYQELFNGRISRNHSVNALSGLYLISTAVWQSRSKQSVWSVSMPSRAYTSFLRAVILALSTRRFCVNALSGLYLISTILMRYTSLNSLMLCQCPLGLIPHFYVPLQKPRFYAVSRACFCRYLSEYSDNSRFSCMLTFWTYLMRCTYP